MAKVEVWPAVHAERKALAAQLEGLRDEQWESASLCAGWSVRDVVAHMTATAKTSPPQFFGKLIGSGFSFTKLQAKDIAIQKGSSPADALSRFRSEISSTTAPPGPKVTWLGETIVHAEDIRRPLGLSHDYPTDAAIAVADSYKGSNLLIGAKKRIAGVRLRATDAD